MNSITRSNWLLLRIVAIFACSLCAFPSLATAQGSQGQNAVFNSSGNCSQCIGSSAFIDAFITQGQHDDFCSTIYNIIHQTAYPAGGAVIDARGISARLTCASGTSPWLESTGYVNKPSTILLPAATIGISYPWVLPNGTKLIGQGTTGEDDIVNGVALPTTIQNSGSITSGAMIQFGDSTNCPSGTCSNIAVEHLTVDGNNQSVTGILNENAGSGSYVQHVTLYRVWGTGLWLTANSGGGSASNSGPYTNINYDTGSSALSTSICANINGLTGTNGIRQLSCVSSFETQQARWR